MSAKDSARACIAKAVEHTARVAPGDANLGRNAEPLGFVREDIYNTLELVEFDRIELAIAIGGVDAMHAGGVQATQVLAKNTLVEAIVVVKRRRDRRPDAMKVFARQSHMHRRASDHRGPIRLHTSLSSGITRSASRRTVSTSF